MCPAVFVEVPVHQPGAQPSSGTTLLVTLPVGEHSGPHHRGVQYARCCEEEGFFLYKLALSCRTQTQTKNVCKMRFSP